MRTDALIGLLSANVEPVDEHAVARYIRRAACAGFVAALFAVFAALKLRPAVDGMGVAAVLAAKVAFAAAVAVCGAALLIRHARPDAGRGGLAVAALPFAAVLAAAGADLAFWPASMWQDRVFLDCWNECVFTIPVIAVLPFAALAAAARRVAAPGDPVRAGALLGLAAGGIGAACYTIHCTGDTLPFVALAYSLAIAPCILAGAALGPRLLRW